MNERTTLSTRLEIARVPTPVGGLMLAVSERGLCALHFADREAPFRRSLEQRFPGHSTARGPRADAVAARLREYLAGAVGVVDTLDVDTGGTPFQQEVWCALRDIPAGEPISYGELARRIGRPGAQRAVGAANGANPVSIVVPCHRVIASDGSLHGYGGGLDRKRWLLDHETRHTFALAGQ